MIHRSCTYHRIALFAVLGGLWALANRAQEVELAVPDGASDAELGGVVSRGR